MPVDLTSFPYVPPQRNALVSPDIARYITKPALYNFNVIKDVLDQLEATLAALPDITNSAVMPSSAKVNSIWLDTSSGNQGKFCIAAYEEGNGTTANWVSLRDMSSSNATSALANSQSPASAHLNSLKADITAMALDQSLDAGELTVLNALKAEMETRVTEIVRAAANFTLTSSAAYTNYMAAFMAWQTLGPIPANPIPSNFATIWNILIDAEAVILALIRSTGNSIISDLNGDVSSIQNTLDEMSDDGKITSAEKIPLKQEYEKIKDEYSNLTALATSLGDLGETSYTSYKSSYDRLVTLIDTTESLFSTMGLTTELTSTVSEFQLAWQQYYIDARVYDNHVSIQFKASLDSFSTTLGEYSTSIANIADDQIVSGGSEKLTLHREWQAVEEVKSGIESRATIYSVPIPSGFTSAYTALDTYLNVTKTVFSDMANDTIDINHSNLNTLFNNFRTAYNSFEATIQTKIIDTLGTLSSSIDSVSSDNIITLSERNIIALEWTQIQNRQSSIVAQASAYSVNVNDLTNKFNYLYTYLNNTVELFTAIDSVIVVRSTFNSAFSNWYNEYKTTLDDVEVSRKASLDNATSAISSITNDGIVNAGSEKRLLKNMWDSIVSQNVVISSHASTFSVSVPSNYTDAYGALDTYLNSTAAIFSIMTNDTAVERGLMESLFSAYRTQYDLLSNSVADAQKNSITTAQPSGYANYTALIDSITADNVIAAGAEKIRFNVLWADIQAAHSTFINQAVEAGIGTANLQNAYDELDTYLNETLDNFTITNVDTNANHLLVAQQFRNYETQKAILTQDIITSALTSVRESMQTVADMNNDGVVTAIEKTTLKRIWDKYTVERNNAVTQANSLGITTERDAMTTAYTALNSYLDSLADGNGIFNDMAASTNLTQSQQNGWDVKWFDFETKIQALLTAIQSIQVSNNISVASDAFKHNGSVAASGNFDMANYLIRDLANGEVSTGSVEATNGGQLYTEQQERIAGDVDTAASANVYADGKIATEVSDRNTAIAVETGNRETAVSNEEIARGNAISTHMGDTTTHGVTGNIVGASDTQTLTNKSINADSNTLSNIEVDNFKSSAIVTDLSTDPNDSNSSLVSAEAVYDMVRSHVDSHKTLVLMSGEVGPFDVYANGTLGVTGDIISANISNSTYGVGSDISVTFPDAGTTNYIILIDPVSGNPEGDTNLRAFVTGNKTSTSFNVYLDEVAGSTQNLTLLLALIEL